jgi:hypothetical protein
MGEICQSARTHIICRMDVLLTATEQSQSRSSTFSCEIISLLVSSVTGYELLTLWRRRIHKFQRQYWNRNRCKCNRRIFTHYFGHSVKCSNQIQQSQCLRFTGTVVVAMWCHYTLVSKLGCALSPSCPWISHPFNLIPYVWFQYSHQIACFKLTE